ncbi:hypothetical protein AJ80_07651 [Polytolypa hystricis UAMH7299]|uniref:Uncharacterized protein n=1 Tax=Polytolypa hystricis (strain UAMH7299) TaxID=1447883 RepID=A0A2B7XL74_POLH7|nr:hypothetical protein AJ80_07651 [Polytolypa hystricis UAMH7299]
MGQPPVPRIPKGTSLSGKTVIVTGGNTGLGFEAARQFLTLNAARVIITARSRSKGAEAVSALRNYVEVKAANPTAMIEVFELDLDDYSSGMEFVKRVKREVKEVDVLVCNAGVNFMDYQLSMSGHERVMQVNCYTHFLIALELLPLLRNTAQIKGTPSHLSFVSSSYHDSHTLSKKPIPASQNIFSYFDDKVIYSGMTRYFDSKFVTNAFVIRLANIVPSSELVVNCLCPGQVATSFNRNLPIWLKGIMSVIVRFRARNVEEGARALVYAGCVAGEESHGGFLQHNKLDVHTPFLNTPRGKEFCEKLWTDTLVELRKLDPELSSFSH